MRIGGNVVTLLQEAIKASREAALTWRLVGPLGTVRWLGGALAAAPAVVRSRSLAPADRALGATFSVWSDGYSFKLEDAEFGICREIFGHDCYGLRPLRGQLRTVIDLGCNCGAFTLMAARLNPDCRILAVDANAAFTATTLRNAAANQVGDRVTARTELVGSAEVDSIQELVDAAACSDRFSPAEAIERLGGCYFLKCDVEGGEHALFGDELDWLRRVRRLAIEYHWDRAAGERLAQRLQAAGFRVELRPHGRLGYVFAMAVR